jgi:RNA-directed DNA polymerase
MGVWESELLNNTCENGEPAPGDPEEERDSLEMDLMEGKMQGTQSPTTVSTRLHKIAAVARKSPGMAITTLSHHIDLTFLREAHRRTRKDGARGVDGQSATEYAQNLEANLTELLNRFKRGSYRAPPVLRKLIPKDGNNTRPIGIPTFEDKVLQRAVAMVVEAVYEQDFYDFSYGFRPGKSAHQALQHLWSGITRMSGCWLIEVDIKGYFDNIEHSRLRDILDLRIRDGVVRRTINKWLKAGVMDEGELSYPKQGSPQGGVMTPPTQ